MANPLSDDRLLKALRAEGCRVVERSGWRTRGRPASTGAWGPINGVMIHHTVTSGTMSSVELCERGHSTLPGPLCHGVIAKDGTVYLISNGRANHAGRGDSAVLGKVQQESYARDSLLRPARADTDGNSRFYGFECINLGNGRDPWPAVQRDAIVRATAAILRAYGGPAKDWTGLSAIGHREWQPGKIDPRTGSGGVSVEPPVLRRLVDERLSHAASWNPGSGTPPKEEDDMPTAQELYEGTWEEDAMGVPADWAAHNPSNDKWKPKSVLIDIGKHVRAVETKLDAQAAVIDKLADALGSANLIDTDALADLKADIRAAIESITVRVDTEPEGA